MPGKAEWLTLLDALRSTNDAQLLRELASVAREADELADAEQPIEHLSTRGIYVSQSGDNHRLDVAYVRAHRRMFGY